MTTLVALHLSDLLEEPVAGVISFSVLVLTSIFLIARRTTAFSEPKQQAWLLSLITSFVLTCASLPFLYEFYQNYPSLEWLNHPSFLARGICAYFLAALALDLVLGCIYYFTFIHWLTGWVHHFAYIALLVYVLKNDVVNHFAVACILELPTFFLSLGHVWKSCRNDIIFGVSFFSTRIAFHSFYALQLFHHSQPRNAYILASILPLHLFWFRGFIVQQRRLFNKRRVVIDASSPLIIKQRLPTENNINSN